MKSHVSQLHEVYIKVHAKVSVVRAIYKGPCMHHYHAKVSEVRAIYIEVHACIIIMQKLVK